MAYVPNSWEIIKYKLLMYNIDDKTLHSQLKKNRNHKLWYDYKIRLLFIITILLPDYTRYNNLVDENLP